MKTRTEKIWGVFTPRGRLKALRRDRLAAKAYMPEADYYISRVTVSWTVPEKPRRNDTELKAMAEMIRRA